MNVSEEIIPKDQIDEMKAIADDIFSEISTAPENNRTQWIDEFVYEWQKNQFSKLEDFEDNELIFSFGIIMANTIVEKFNWEWVNLTFHDFDDWETRAIVSPERSLMILPFSHINECISGQAEVKIYASFVALESNIIPKLEAYSYNDVMNGVQRILPRL